jgi:hypothetical protein
LHFREIFRYFRIFLIKYFCENENKFSPKCEKENFRFNPNMKVRANKMSFTITLLVTIAKLFSYQFQIFWNSTFYIVKNCYFCLRYACFSLYCCFITVHTVLQDVLYNFFRRKQALCLLNTKSLSTGHRLIRLFISRVDTKFRETKFRTKN